MRLVHHGGEGVDEAIEWRVGTANTDVLAAGPPRLWTQCDGNHVCALNRTTGARAFRLRSDIGAAPTTLAANFAIVGTLIVRAGNGHIIGELGGINMGYPGVRSGIANGHIIATDGRDVDVFALAD
jgi:hypothetical protein